MTPLSSLRSKHQQKIDVCTSWTLWLEFCINFSTVSLPDFSQGPMSMIGGARSSLGAPSSKAVRFQLDFNLKANLLKHANREDCQYNELVQKIKDHGQDIRVRFDRSRICNLLQLSTSLIMKMEFIAGWRSSTASQRSSRMHFVARRQLPPIRSSCSGKLWRFFHVKSL